jgi:hypothetical protein
MFYVGQKVVCVDASPADDGTPVTIRHGDTYTISGFDQVPNFLGGHGVYLWEAEAHDHFGVIGGELWFIGGAFRASRFRPVVERKTSIEIFERMLTPNRQRERAEVGGGVTQSSSAAGDAVPGVKRLRRPLHRLEKSSVGGEPQIHFGEAWQ